MLWKTRTTYYIIRVLRRNRLKTNSVVLIFALSFYSFDISKHKSWNGIDKLKIRNLIGWRKKNACLVNEKFLENSFTCLKYEPTPFDKITQYLVSLFLSFFLSFSPVPLFISSQLNIHRSTPSSHFRQIQVRLVFPQYPTIHYSRERSGSKRTWLAMADPFSDSWIVIFCMLLRLIHSKRFTVKEEKKTTFNQYSL